MTFCRFLVKSCDSYEGVIGNGIDARFCRGCRFKNRHLRGRFDKYLTSSPEGATIGRMYYCYRIVHSRRRLLSNFQSNRTRSFVLTAYGNGRVREFYNN